MGRKRYYFPYIVQGHPMFHVAVTSKTLIERVDEVANVFKKYAENSNAQSPRYILYLMSRQNESLLELSDWASAPDSDSTSPKVKSSPESSSAEKRIPSVSSLKRTHLSFDDSTKSGSLKKGYVSAHQTVFVSPSKKGCSTISEATDLVTTTHDQPQECTSTETSSVATSERKLLNPIKKTKNDINPTSCFQEHISPSDKAKMAKKPDSGSQAKEFKIPVIPDKDEKKVSKPPKRPKLCNSLADIPEFVSPGKKAKTLIHSAEDDEMDISPNNGDKMNDSPSKDGKVIAISPDKIESEQKIKSLFSSIPIMKDDGIEIEVSSKSEESPGPTFSVSSAEIANLVDDPSRVESIRKEVEERLKVSISPKKTKGDISPSDKSSNRSPRKLLKSNSPGKDIKNMSRSDPEIKSPSVLSHPNVMVYLKLRFKSVLYHRKKYMGQIYNFLEEFDGDVKFLYFYSTNVLLTVQEIAIEGKVFFTRDLGNRKGSLIKNATELSNNLRSLSNTIKLDNSFWAQCLNEIRKLNEKNESLLSAESGSTVESLREYEFGLRMIWDRMDHRVLLGEGLRSSLIGIAADFINLTKDFAKYLAMVEIIIPSSLVSSEGEKRKLRISWH